MSTFGYARLKCALQEAMDRYGRWIGAPEVAPPQLVGETDKVDLALIGEKWRGLAVFIYPSEAGTVFEELSGGLGTRTADDWLRLAQGGDLVYDDFNDAVGYAQIVVIEEGRLVRAYLQDEQEPDEDVDSGRLPVENGHPFENWMDAMGWVEDDARRLGGPTEGWLWIHQLEFDGP